jgi:hypothetical protein
MEEKRISIREERMMMTMTRAQPTLRTPPWRDAGNGNFDLDPAHLGATLRELALRAHQLVRATDASRTAPGPVASDLEQELTEVHSRIIQLERSIEEQDLGDNLASYVSALRQRVEERLA